VNHALIRVRIIHVGSDVAEAVASSLNSDGPTQSTCHRCGLSESISFLSPIKTRSTCGPTIVAITQGSFAWRQIWRRDYFALYRTHSRKKGCASRALYIGDNLRRGCRLQVGGAVQGRSESRQRVVAHRRAGRETRLAQGRIREHDAFLGHKIRGPAETGRGGFSMAGVGKAKTQGRGMR